MSKLGVKIALAYAAISFIWGSTWIAIRYGLESLTPIFSAGARFSLASIFIFTLMRIKNISLQTDKVAIRLYLLMSFFSFVIPFGLVYWAQQFIPSGMAAVLFAVYPFWIVIFSHIRIPSDFIGFFKIFGTVLGFTGIVIIFSDSFVRRYFKFFNRNVCGSTQRNNASMDCSFNKKIRTSSASTFNELHTNGNCRNINAGNCVLHRRSFHFKF